MIATNDPNFLSGCQSPSRNPETSSRQGAIQTGTRHPDCRAVRCQLQVPLSAEREGSRRSRASLSLRSREPEVLFYLPDTHSWLHQLMVGLILICHSSYRGVVELLRDLFDWSTCASTVHNRMREAAQRAESVNASEDLSGIRVGLHDEIFHSGQPVLAGVCAFSNYCYLLVAAEQRVGDTWGWHLLETSERGLAPEVGGSLPRTATVFPKPPNLCA